MRYRVLDLPMKGVGAFTPMMSTNPVASSYGLTHLSGSPGTDPVPAPKPTALVPISEIRETQSSYVSPDVTLPDKYVPFATNMGPSQHFGMAARRQTPIPVPAVSWIATAQAAMAGTAVGGRIAMIWPRAFQRWGGS